MKFHATVDKSKIVAGIFALLISAILNSTVHIAVSQSWQEYSHPFSYSSPLIPIPSISSDLATAANQYSTITYQLPGLAAIHEAISSVPSSQPTTLTITLQQNNTILGQNVTFRVDASSVPNDEDLLLWVYLVDPNGFVQGAFPSGKLPTVPGITVQLPTSIDQSELTSMQTGHATFTYQIPTSNILLGRWTIFVFGVLEGGYFTPGPYYYGPPSSWTATTFDVITPSESISLLTIGIGAFGYIAGTVVAYDLILWCIRRAASIGILELLKRHPTFILAAIALCVYFVLVLILGY